MGVVSKAGDWTFKAFMAGLGLATIYLAVNSPASGSRNVRGDRPAAVDIEKQGVGSFDVYITCPCGKRDYTVYLSEDNCSYTKVIKPAAAEADEVEAVTIQKNGGDCWSVYLRCFCGTHYVLQRPGDECWYRLA